MRIVFFKNYYSFSTILVLIGALFYSPQFTTHISIVKKQSGPPPKYRTVLSIKRPVEQDLGVSFTISATLSTRESDPIGDVGINYYVDGMYYGRGRTDLNGNATILIKDDLTAGSHTLRAEFRGNHFYEGTSSTGTFVIKPSTVEVITVPPIPDVNFRLGDRQFSTDKDGVGKITVNKARVYTLEMLPYSSSDPNMKVEFGRWLDEDYFPSREITVPLKDPLQVGLNLSFKVGQSFLDLYGQPVDPSRVTSFTLKSGQGEIYNFTNGDLRWLPASRVARRVNGLEQVKIQYSVMNVTVDGSNVVNQAQQRFYGKPGDIWNISLLLFSAHIQGVDALFKSHVGTGVELEYPDGHSEIFPFSPDGDATITSLARGLYHVRIVGVKGISPRTPIALSQDQEAGLMVVTWLDITIAATLGLSLAIGLLLVGRPRIMMWLQKKAALDSRSRSEPVEEGT